LSLRGGDRGGGEARPQQHQRNPGSPCHHGSLLNFCRGRKPELFCPSHAAKQFSCLADCPNPFWQAIVGAGKPLRSALFREFPVP
jgi:hypothetical protein